MRNIQYSVLDVQVTAGSDQVIAKCPCIQVGEHCPANEFLMPVFDPYLVE